MYGWLYSNIGGETLLTGLDDRFPDDKVLCRDGEEILVLDGVILNKQELMTRRGGKCWQEEYRDLTAEPDFMGKLRGCFCGLVKRESEKWLCFTNQIGDMPLFYYEKDGSAAVSSDFQQLMDFLRGKGILPTYYEPSARCILTYGHLIGGMTCAAEIKRLLPGQLLSYDHGVTQVRQYHRFASGRQKKADIDKLDNLFRQAVKREFEKDREYGYEHLCDISGGLDSRMTAWVAHDMGYRPMTNLCYSQSGYLDETIARDIAKYLGSAFVFEALDDPLFIKDIRSLTGQNYGTAFACAITGGERLLKTLDFTRFGLEHTGQLGDAVLGDSYCGGRHTPPRHLVKAYSRLLHYDFPEEWLSPFENQELFDLYNRGFLGILGTHLIRRQYTPAVSPFLDVDFMEYCLALAPALRKGHKLYIRWILEKYPQAARFPWEKRNGSITASPCLLSLKKRFQKPGSMNPFDEWYQNSGWLKPFLENRYRELACPVSEPLRRDLQRLFSQGNTIDKLLALTVMETYDIYFGVKL